MEMKLWYRLWPSIAHKKNVEIKEPSTQ